MTDSVASIALDDDDEPSQGRSLAESYASLSRAASLNAAALQPLLDSVAETVRLSTATWQPQLAALQTDIIPKAQLAAISSLAAAIPRTIVMPSLPPDLTESIRSMAQAVASSQASALAQITAHMPQLPDLSGFQKMLAGTALSPGILEWLRTAHRPGNWSDAVEEQIDAVVELVNDDGIPVAWVPRTATLEELLTASSGNERSLILIARRDEILEDCASALARLEDDSAEFPALPIVQKVLAGCRDGHWEIAAVTAVTIVHGTVEALRWASDRQRAARQHALQTDEGRDRLLEQATRAPLVRFYDEWHAKSGKPRPAHLSRHVVAHDLAPDQVTERNCIVAVMLMASLLRTVYELELGREDTRP
ncbi:hypothetical protein ET445_13855 [Agromyces protaetiae]|uniref:Uncharacterized protein n=1 Tax=Agromyces protaetiae TaxID=2509455 RepID=A0A4P6FJT9_9MICO|nr:hypothetical protein [Agromyces protaetiae]QAY74247.1 hypothetical protein ET445_13855 [Agromyces protaetiae]